jgi:hypothetical protein
VVEFKQVQRVRIDNTSLRMKVPTLSIVFDDGDADTEIHDSDIQGMISFYGRPATVKLPLPSLPVGGFPTTSPGKVSFTQSKGRLRLTSNRLDALAISREMAVSLSSAAAQLLEGGSASVDGVLLDAVIVGNSFDASASQLVSLRLVLSSNTFMGKPTDKEELAVFFAGGAGVVGNVAMTLGDGAKLYIITPAGYTQKAANLVFISPP